MSKPPTARMRFTVENGEPVLYCEVKGRGRFIPIAKRYSGENWISVEPGYTVRGSEPGSDYSTIEIEYSPARAQAHSNRGAYRAGGGAA
jgi:hypothetical protein